jgi:hypothetical protein
MKELQERNATVARVHALRLITELRKAIREANAAGEERWCRRLEYALTLAAALKGSLEGDLWLVGRSELRVTRRADRGVVIAREPREEPQHTPSELAELYWQASLEGFSALADWRGRSRPVRANEG